MTVDKHFLVWRTLFVGGLLKILRIPSILVASYSVFAASIAIGFLSATLEPHLRQVILWYHDNY